MNSIHVITPVKDSIDTTLRTVHSVMNSIHATPFTYTVYNDFSTPENTRILHEAAQKEGFEVIDLTGLTDHPSPNYLLTLQTSRRRALAEGAGLLIVESDVTVRPDTIQGLADGAKEHPDCGIAAAVTVDQYGHINYPYLYAQGMENQAFSTRKHCSFCCSLLTPALLRAVDFDLLDSKKNWFDVTISHRSLKAGFKNYLFATLPVLHSPHGSRPWKQLKYTNPMKYYWLKLTKGLDKI